MSDQQSTSRIDDAVTAFLARQDRTQHPDGKPDKGGRWYPSDAEYQLCCDKIRRPSRSYPWSYMVHCRTAEHVANLFEVDVKDVRKAARKVRPPKTAARLGGEFFKAVARTDDGRLVSIYDGETEYTIGETLVQRVGKAHGGGYYVRRTPEGALQADVPPSSALLDAERVVVKVRAEGQYTVYSCACNECYLYRSYGPTYNSTVGLILNAPAQADQPDHDKIAFSRVTPLEVVTV